LPSPPAAPREQGALAIACQVGERVAGGGVAHDGAHGHAQLDVAAAAAILFRAVPAIAILCAMDACIAVVDQRVEVAVGHRPHAAAAPAVAAARPAARHGPLAPEGSAAVPALAGVHFDLRLVDEFHGLEMKKPYRER